MINNIGSHLNNQGIDTDQKATICWISSGKYALYMLPCSHVQGLSEEIKDIDAKFSTFLKSSEGIYVNTFVFIYLCYIYIYLCIFIHIYMCI
jgi:hypothetical protein